MRRALIAGGLSVALLSAAAGSAGAATITPASSDFGRVLIGHKTPARTFTFTKGSELSYELQPDESTFVINNLGSGFSQTAASQISPNCPGALTASHPSCTIQAYFQPDSPGPNRGVVFANYLDGASPLSQLTGIGMLPRSSFFCRTENGKPINKKLWKYCLRKKKKK